MNRRERKRPKGSKAGPRVQRRRNAIESNPKLQFPGTKLMIRLVQHCWKETDVEKLLTSCYMDYPLLMLIIAIITFLHHECEPGRRGFHCLLKSSLNKWLFRITGSSLVVLAEKCNHCLTTLMKASSKADFKEGLSCIKKGLSSNTFIYMIFSQPGNSCCGSVWLCWTLFFKLESIQIYSAVHVLRLVRG